MTRTIRFTLPIAGLSMPAQQEALRVAIYQRLPAGWRVDNLGKNLSADGKEAAITLQVSPMGNPMGNPMAGTIRRMQGG